jgi:hypothetical protein
MPSDHLVLPRPLPDETLYSLVARVYSLNDDTNEREFCTRLLGDTEMLRVADTEVDFPWFERVTDGFYGDSKIFLGNTTLCGFYGRLGASPDVEAPREFPPGNEPLKISTGLATLANGRPHIWKGCWSCVFQDERDHGMAYWHRTHQLPGVVVCLKHGEPLFELTLLHRERQRDFILPGRVAAQFDFNPGGPTVPMDSLANRLAAMANEILLDDILDNSPAVIQGALLDGFNMTGLVKRGGRIDKHGFTERFRDFYRNLCDTKEFSPHLGERSLMRLADLLTGAVQLLPATLTVMLVLWLFGSWGLFRERCVWRNAFQMGAASQDFLVMKKSSARDQEKLRATHRQACVDFLQSHPGAIRTEFWHSQPKSCRWLCVHDEEWLALQLPLNYACHRQMQLF